MGLSLTSPREAPNQGAHFLLLPLQNSSTRRKLEIPEIQSCVRVSWQAGRISSQNLEFLEFLEFTMVFGVSPVGAEAILSGNPQANLQASLEAYEEASCELTSSNPCCKTTSEHLNKHPGKPPNKHTRKPAGKRQRNPFQEACTPALRKLGASFFASLQASIQASL